MTPNKSMKDFEDYVTELVRGFYDEARKTRDPRDSAFAAWEKYVEAIPLIADTARRWGFKLPRAKAVAREIAHQQTFDRAGVR